MREERNIIWLAKSIEDTVLSHVMDMKNINKSSKFYTMNKLSCCKHSNIYLDKRNFFPSRYSAISYQLPTAKYKQGTPIIPSTRTESTS